MRSEDLDPMQLSFALSSSAASPSVPSREVTAPSFPISARAIVIVLLDLGEELRPLNCPISARRVQNRTVGTEMCRRSVASGLPRAAVPTLVQGEQTRLSSLRAQLQARVP